MEQPPRLLGSLLPLSTEEQTHVLQAPPMIAAPGWALVRADNLENTPPPLTIARHANDSQISVHPVHGCDVNTCSLSDLCDLIDEHSSLKSATILSASCYSQIIVGVVKHRFLILELARTGRKKLWLRLDRRTDPVIGKIRFVLNLGKTPANDVVSPHVLPFQRFHA
jgi:hypothetical protein